MNVIELNQVTKKFQKLWQTTTIIENLNLTIKMGEFVVLRGENGAGKTTLLNLILGLLKPSSGEVKLMGMSSQDTNSKNSVGAVLQDTQVPKNVKIRELIELFRSYYPHSASTEEILNKVNLKYKENSLATSLSGGQRQRLYFALALTGNPDLLILDEPTRNLDEKGYEEFWVQIKSCTEKGITILMVTNNKSDWTQLNNLATRSITLQSIASASKDGQIVDENLFSQKAVKVPILTPKSDISRPLWLKSLLIFARQIQFEINQFLRTPSYLVSLLVIIGVAIAVLKLNTSNQEGLVMVSLCAAIFGILLIELLGKRISFEKVEGWLKLLKVTPLPTPIYLIAKIAASVLISTVGILIICGAGKWYADISINLLSVSFLSSLILAMLPIGILSLALGYLLESKAANLVLNFFLVIIPMFSIDLKTIGMPSLIPTDAIALSPFYHSLQVILWSAKLKFGLPIVDHYIQLHFLWLIWAVFAFSLLTIWSYQQEKVVQ